MASLGCSLRASPRATPCSAGDVPSARTEGYSRSGLRARAGSAPSRVVLHVLEDGQVEITALLLALLEVLGADVGAESNQEEHSVAAPSLPMYPERLSASPTSLRTSLLRRGPLCNGLAEVEGVEVSDPNQLPRGFLGVVLRGITGSRRSAARNGARRSPSP
jgi:hypothetical protein